MTTDPSALKQKPSTSCPARTLSSSGSLTEPFILAAGEDGAIHGYLHDAFLAGYRRGGG